MPEHQSKVVSLEQIGKLISNNDVVAIGGTLSARQPMALIREIIRQGVTGITTVGGAHGIDVDLLCAGGCVGAVHNSFVGFELDFGLAPNYRRLAQEKKLEIRDTDCNFVLNQLRAAQFGIPFMPMPLVKGTDLLELHPEYKTITCPYSEQEITLVPALKPDVAIIHANYGDKNGNIKLFKPHFMDLLIASAARTTIVSVEEFISEEEIKNMDPELPGHHVDAVIHIPFGAHPTACYPNYVYDRQHISQYVKLAQQGARAFEEEYLKVYVYGAESNEKYLELIGSDKKLKQLEGWQTSLDNWKEAFIVNGD